MSTKSQQMAQDSANELLEVCLRFGWTGVVDEEYMQNLMDDPN
jgi:hypothetical protein